MKHLYIFLLFAFSAIQTFAQLYQGPAIGTIASGVTVTTNSFSEAALVLPREQKIHNKAVFEPGTEPENPNPTPITPRIYCEDRNISPIEDTARIPLVLKTFNGMNETNSIPPDPYLAVGPNHIITTVNTSFAIFDKAGNRLKLIDAAAWFHSVLSVAGPFDPKVIYDHFDHRWIMVWLDQDGGAQRSYILISVSDDDNPLGTWYNWAIPGGMNGTTAVANWSDYQGVGYDSTTLYITSNQFDYTSSGNIFQYSKIRMVPKAQMYANTAGEIGYIDLWDIRYPQNLNSRIFSLRPSRAYTDKGEYYLVHLPSGSASQATVYKIENVTSNPTMTGAAYNMTSWLSAPNANQLGGSTTLLEGGGSGLRNEPIFRDNKLYLCHSIRNPSYSGYSALHYFQIDVKNTVQPIVEDMVLGAYPYWYFYSALAVDQIGNVGITYSRSGDQEYAGAFLSARFTGRTTLSSSLPMQTGKGNYVKTFSGTRNRWGDYNGAWLDPADEMSIWMFTEFVASTNTWGTWTTQVRLEPFTGVYAQALTPSIRYSYTEVGANSDTLTVSIANFGKSDYTLDSIRLPNAQFEYLAPVVLPRVLKTYDTLSFKLIFKPTAAGVTNDTIRFIGNDPAFKGVAVYAKGYLILPVTEKTVYGISGTGQLVTLNKITGSGTVVGPSGFYSVASLAVHPKTKLLYGLRTNEASQPEILRFTPQTGEAYTYRTFAGISLASIAFDTAGTLFGAARAGDLYTIDLTNRTALRVDSIKTQIASIAFHPKTNQLWATVFKAIGTGKDKIVKVNLATGDTTNVGATGFATVTNSIIFDEGGNLYGIKGITAAVADLIKIDTTTAVGTLVGSTGITGMTALGYYPRSLTSVKRDNSVPSDFALNQNYPNPFNPATVINYSIGAASSVMLTVYDILGNTVQILVNETKPAGVYSVSFNGAGLSSGVYFYELTAKHSGGEFRDIRKLTLMK